MEEGRGCQEEEENKLRIQKFRLAAVVERNGERGEDGRGVESGGGVAILQEEIEQESGAESAQGGRETGLPVALAEEFVAQSDGERHERRGMGVKAKRRVGPVAEGLDGDAIMF